VFFPFNKSLKNELQEKFPTAKWSASKKCWYLPDVNAIRSEIGMALRAETGKAAICQIHPTNQEAFNKMHKLLLLKAYSPNTIQTYCVEFAQLLYLLKDTHVDILTPDRLRSYILYCIRNLKLSENTVHSRLNAIKFYFEQVLRREKMFFRRNSTSPKKINFAQSDKQRRYLKNFWRSG
jgi:hypothetical protein